MSDYTIPDVSEFVVNTMFLRNHNGGTHLPFALSVTVLDDNYDEIITVIEPFDMGGDPDRDDADFLLGALGYHTINSIFLSEPDAIIRGHAFITMVLNPNLSQAEEWTAHFQEGVDIHKIPTVGMIATNGKDWTDIYTARSGTVPDGYTTVFEEYNMFSGKKSFEHTDFNLTELDRLDDND